MDVDDSAIGPSAQFIRDAQQDITTTKPGNPGTFVPGNLNGQAGPDGEPLTHNFYDTNLRTANRTKAINTCKKYYGANYTTGPNGEAFDCDEYPFSATYEGTFTVLDERTTGRTFAVRPLLASANQLAGSAWSAWLSSDDVLDGDPFWAVITG
jgi:hypothetical protein